MQFDQTDLVQNLDNVVQMCMTDSWMKITNAAAISNEDEIEINSETRFLPAPRKAVRRYMTTKGKEGDELLFIKSALHCNNVGVMECTILKEMYEVLEYFNGPTQQTNLMLKKFITHINWVRRISEMLLETEQSHQIVIPCMMSGNVVGILYCTSSLVGKAHFDDIMSENEWAYLLKCLLALLDFFNFHLLNSKEKFDYKVILFSQYLNV